MTIPLYYTGIIETTKIKGDIKCTPYIYNNANCRIFVVTNEFMQDYVKFQSVYGMSKECFNIFVENKATTMLVNKHSLVFDIII